MQGLRSARPARPCTDDTATSRCRGRIVHLSRRNLLRHQTNGHLMGPYRIAWEDPAMSKSAVAPASDRALPTTPTTCPRTEGCPCLLESMGQLADCDLLTWVSVHVQRGIEKGNYPEGYTAAQWTQETLIRRLAAEDSAIIMVPKTIVEEFTSERDLINSLRRAARRELRSLQKGSTG